MGILGLKTVLRYGRHGIVVRLMGVALFLGLLGVLARALILQPVLKSDILTLSADHQMAIAGYVARDIEEKLQQRLRFLAGLSTQFPLSLVGDDLATATWLEERGALLPLFSEGLRLVVVDSSPEAVKQLPDWAQDALTASGPVIGRPRRDADGVGVLTMAAAIRDHGRAVAVLAGTARLDAPGLLDLVARQRVARTGGFLLVDPKDGLFVVSSDPANTLTPLPNRGVNPLHDRAMDGYRGSGQTVNADGIAEVSAMASVPVTGWFVVARLPLDEVERPLQSLHRVMIVGGALLPLLVFVVMGTALPPMFRPLIQAARRMHEMAHGRAAIEPLPVERRDEVGELAEGFNFLLSHLRKKEAALQESEAQMAHLAHHDSLTGLPNRALLEDRLDHALARAGRQGGRVDVLYIDLDRFKPINDSLGHDVGDQVLCHVAYRLAGLLRKSDTLARIGGDEFVILAEESDGLPPDGPAIAAKCLDALLHPFVVAGHTLTIGASIGLARYPDDGQSLGDLLRCADQAMYRQKQAARA